MSSVQIQPNNSIYLCRDFSYCSPSRFNEYIRTKMIQQCIGMLFLSCFVVLISYVFVDVYKKFDFLSEIMLCERIWWIILSIGKKWVMHNNSVNTDFILWHCVRTGVFYAQFIFYVLCNIIDTWHWRSEHRYSDKNVIYAKSTIRFLRHCIQVCRLKQIPHRDNNC